jgi:hypothetical protein
MTRAIYKREGNSINPEPILVEVVGPQIEFNPEALIKIIAQRLVETTKASN